MKFSITFVGAAVKILTERGFVRARNRAKLKIEESADGEILIELDKPYLRLDSVSMDKSSPLMYWSKRRRIKCYLVGRCREAPFRYISDRAIKRRFPPLCGHRSVIVESSAELRLVVEALLRGGRSTQNDVYVFPPDGRWLLYVSHHAEMNLEVSLIT
jgi:hypothetical protein